MSTGTGLDNQHSFDEDEKPEPGRKLKTFECPDCNADNPEAHYVEKDVVICNYCGMQFQVEDSDGKWKFREV
mgnify:CR=1 FL=1